jgi:hypothetical protein
MKTKECKEHCHCCHKCDLRIKWEKIEYVSFTGHCQKGYCHTCDMGFMRVVLPNQK